MGSNEQNTANGKSNSNRDDISRVRRRLVKSAVAAAPVVLTLRSGAAMALASSYQCIAKNHVDAAAAPPDPLLVPGQTTDTWVRQTVNCKKLTDGTWVYQNPDTGDWHKESDNSPTVDPGSPYDTCEVLVNYFENGTKDGFGKVSGPNPGPVMASCWASFG